MKFIFLVRYSETRTVRRIETIKDEPPNKGGCLSAASIAIVLIFALVATVSARTFQAESKTVDIAGISEDVAQMSESDLWFYGALAYIFAGIGIYRRTTDRTRIGKMLYLVLFPVHRILFALSHLMLTLPADKVATRKIRQHIK